MQLDEHATLEGWYASHRPSYAPRTLEVLAPLTAKIMREDFPRLLEEDGVLLHLWLALDHAFLNFDPDRGDPDEPLRERFEQAFRVWLRQHLKREDRRLRRGRARRPWP